MDNDWRIFGCSSYMLFPLLLVYFEHAIKLRFSSFDLHFGHFLSTIFLHKIVLIKVKVIFSLLLELLFSHEVLVVVLLSQVNILLEDFLRGWGLLHLGPVAHFDLDVFPFCGDATCHSDQ